MGAGASRWAADGYVSPRGWCIQVAAGAAAPGTPTTVPPSECGLGRGHHARRGEALACPPATHSAPPCETRADPPALVLHLPRRKRTKQSEQKNRPKKAGPLGTHRAPSPMAASALAQFSRLAVARARRHLRGFCRRGPPLARLALAHLAHSARLCFAARRAGERREDVHCAPSSPARGGRLPQCSRGRRAPCVHSAARERRVFVCACVRRVADGRH